MFVCSLKASKIKLLASVFACAAVFALTVAFLPDDGESVTVNGTQYDKDVDFDGIKGESDLKEFIEDLGYKTESAPLEKVKVEMPKKLDAVLEKYNDLQKSQGFNLAKYKNKTLDRYTYILKEVPGVDSLPESDVLLTVILYKDKVVGGDLYFTGETPRVEAFVK